MSHAGNPILLQNLGMLDHGPYYLGHPILAENLSQHFDYCVSVSLSHLVFA